MARILWVERTRLGAWMVGLALAACAGDGSGDGAGNGDSYSVTPPSTAQPVGGQPSTVAPNMAAIGGGSAGMTAAPMQSPSAMAGMGAGPALPAAGMGATPVAGDGAAMPAMPLPAAGPEDGDPNAPVIEAPGVTCGPNPSLFGLTSTNVMIGGRGVHVAYPCNKHKGAPAVFVLNLHGTMPDESLKLYQVAYFSINAYVDSHNLITAAPKSVVSQWGNGDNGADLPHIMEVIDWVYTTFADFDIRAMWIAGHSWGAMYSTRLACEPALADKIKGAVLQSGSGLPPACTDRISVISSAAENDIGPVIDLTSIGASHGCGAMQMAKLGNNDEKYWPDCDPGFTFASYVMLGKAHADYMDAVVVERIADLIKLARP